MPIQDVIANIGVIIVELPLVILLAYANKAIVDYLVAPLKQKYKGVDFWFLLYVALATGFAIGWFAEVNLFSEALPNLLLGRILTSIMVGGGSSLIHDIFDKPH